MDCKSTLVLILGYPLLICTKFKVHYRQQFVHGQQTRGLTTKNVFARMEVCLSYELFVLLQCVGCSPGKPSTLYLNIVLILI